MKNLIAGIFVLFSFNCLAHELAVVDVDFLFKNSNKGKSIQKKFEKLNKDLNNEFLKKEKSFREEEQNIASKKNVLSEDEFKKEVQKFQEKIKEYNSKKQKKLKKFNIDKADEYSKLYKYINDILIEYSKENNIATTLDRKNVIMTKKENDITKKILDIINK